MANYAKDYINRKIENCENLVENASSQEQKEIYQEYLVFWQRYLPLILSKEIPTIPAKKSEETIVDIADQYADVFEFENAPKQAYYKRDGKTHKTKAFKEYLNQITK